MATRPSSTLRLVLVIYSTILGPMNTCAASRGGPSASILARMARKPGSTSAVMSRNDTISRPAAAISERVSSCVEKKPAAARDEGERDEQDQEPSP